MKIVHFDENYKQTVSQYTKYDAICAIGIYLGVMVSYYVMGILYSKYNMYLGVHVNIAIGILCVVLVLARKQKLSSIGFTTNNLKRSVLIGSGLGLCITLINVVPNMVVHSQFVSIGRLVYNTFYYFIVIALVEEIIFRGYIQTRIYGFIKNNVLAVLVTGILFMTMHIPYQMGAAQMDLVTFILNNFVWLLLTFGWHVVFNFLYAKNNSIVAPAVFHGFLDWSGYLYL
jgi:membrane protease YdiL (CAAX protease family)